MKEIQPCALKETGQLNDIHRGIFLKYEREVKDRHKRELAEFRDLYTRNKNIPSKTKMIFLFKLKSRHNKELAKYRNFFEITVAANRA